MKTILTTATFILSACAATLAYAAPVKTADSTIGAILTDDHGMTLYTFKKDKEGVSNCNGGCAKFWPPLMAEDGATAVDDYSIITRKDGSHQWAKGGMPLYLWAKDNKAGDGTGDGVKTVWDAARP